MLKVQVIHDDFFNVVDTTVDEVTLADGFKFLEGPVWNGNEGTLIFSVVYQRNST